jgi:hypothetical protein
MQIGPYLHPTLGMSGVWPLRILITNRSVFPADFLHRRIVTASANRARRVPSDTPDFPAYSQMYYRVVAGAGGSFPTLGPL